MCSVFDDVGRCRLFTLFLAQIMEICSQIIIGIGNWFGGSIPPASSASLHEPNRSV